MGTFELLMTLPMRPSHLVLGKYLASLAFYAITLACTLTIPLSVAWLGDPDLGAVVCGYAGALLLGGLFLAVGIFVSGLFKDQITAFVLTLLACSLFVLAGTPFFVAILDGWIKGFGSFLSGAFAISPHFEGIQRGVLGISDVLFFVSFAVVFLFLNTLSLEGRKY
jgi:ABC-2 type transport system permease protein